MTQEFSDQSREQLSRDLGWAIEEIYVQTPLKEFDDLVKSYQQIESKFLPKVAGDEFFTLETKRRIAEMILYTAIDKQCEFEACQKLLEDLSRLGFTNLEKKSNVLLIYSRYCLLTKHNEEGIRLLENLSIGLEDELRHADLLVYRQLLQTLKDLLRKLRP